jgi:hypothetical protein
MANPLVSYVNSGIAVTIYQNIQRDIPSHIIFNSMAEVSQRRGQSFVLPASPSEYQQKHTELINLISRFMSILDRRSMFFELIDEIYLQLTVQNETQYIEQLLKIAVVDLGDNIKLRLGQLGAWSLEWDVALETENGRNQRTLPAFLYASNWGTIVPPEVLQYIKSGIYLYNQKIYPTALALLSIAVEATLRDILSTRGYSFTHGGNKVDVFEYTKANVDANQTGYTLVLTQHVPQPPTNFSSSFGSASPIEIKIRRCINQRKNRVDLIIQVPPALVDHWSTDQVQQAGDTKNLGGLGEALDKARNIERIITNDDLPEDIDVVIKAVRDNLVHFSSNNLDEVLIDFAWRSPTGVFKLRDFLNDKELVFDLITGIPEFVNAQYVKLWQNNIRIP